MIGSNISEKIQILREEIWQRSNVHTRFPLRTGAIPAGSAFSRTLSVPGCVASYENDEGLYFLPGVPAPWKKSGNERKKRKKTKGQNFHGIKCNWYSLLKQAWGSLPGNYSRLIGKYNPFHLLYTFFPSLHADISHQGLSRLFNSQRSSYCARIVFFFPCPPPLPPPPPGVDALYSFRARLQNITECSGLL